MITYILPAVFTLFGIVMLCTLANRKHAFICSLVTMVSGGGALLMLHFYGDRLGFAPPINLFNTALSLIMGIPGAALIEAVNIWA